MDPIAELKEQQKKGWSTFGPTELNTCQAATRLATFAEIRAGQSVLDVACGTGVVALAAAARGAKVTGVDLTPELVALAKANATIARADIAFVEGDVEALPFPDGSFDVVLSQFGHMFAPRPAIAIREMLRVLRPGGRIAFNTWPPELYVGRFFGILGRHMPPPPGVPSVVTWGDPAIVRERLGDGVMDLVFDRGTLRGPCLSVRHLRVLLEGTIAPLKRLVQVLANEPAKLEAVRDELDALGAEFWEPGESVVRQDFLLTRATKR